MTPILLLSIFGTLIVVAVIMLVRWARTKNHNIRALVFVIIATLLSLIFLLSIGFVMVHTTPTVGS